jgi:AcrR family transcriptional regulator
MSPHHPPPSLRERAKRAVQAELLDVAQRLFVDQGYEATTVDQIATVAGMSKRSFFRYFKSKEDLVMGKYERLGEDLASSLAARPLEEPLWTALRRVFDYVTDYSADADSAFRMATMDGIVRSSDTLRAALLDRLERMQGALTAVARDRAAAVGAPWAADDPVPRAIVGAAFACLSAARTTSAAAGRPLAESLDQAMAAIAPADQAAANRHSA